MSPPGNEDDTVKPVKPYTMTLDDDPMIHRIIEASTGITSLPYVHPDSLLERAAHFNPICFFIDVELPGGSSGLDLIPRLRERWPFVPIMVVSASSDGAVVGAALAAGANDFLAKPVDARELRGRLHARQREMRELQALKRIAYGDLRIDPLSRMVECAAGSMILAPSCFVLLVALIEGSGMSIDRESLKRRIWGSRTVTENSLDRLISDLRRHLFSLNSAVRIRCRKRVGVAIQTIDESRAA